MICLLTILAEGSVRMHVLKLSYKWVADFIGQQMKSWVGPGNKARYSINVVVTS